MRRSLQIDRVVVTGVAGALPDASALQPLIEAAVRAAVGDAALPPGRRMQAVVQMQAPALASADAVARAIGNAVAHAAHGGTRHG
jgi:hypothetical protein